MNHLIVAVAMIKIAMFPIMVALVMVMVMMTMQWRWRWRWWWQWWWRWRWWWWWWWRWRWWWWWWWWWWWGIWWRDGKMDTQRAGWWWVYGGKEIEGWMARWVQGGRDAWIEREGLVKANRMMITIGLLLQLCWCMAEKEIYLRCASLLADK